VTADKSIISILLGRSQNLRLFKRGKLMSTTPNMVGTKRFPNPLIAIGITIKKIINIACEVTITL
jgi:hypothetical protein